MPIILPSRANYIDSYKFGIGPIELNFRRHVGDMEFVQSRKIEQNIKILQSCGQNFRLPSISSPFFCVISFFLFFFALF